MRKVCPLKRGGWRRVGTWLSSNSNSQQAAAAAAVALNTLWKLCGGLRPLHPKLWALVAKTWKVQNKLDMLLTSVFLAPRKAKVSSGQQLGLFFALSWLLITSPKPGALPSATAAFSQLWQGTGVDFDCCFIVWETLELDPSPWANSLLLTFPPNLCQCFQSIPLMNWSSSHARWNIKAH